MSNEKQTGKPVLTIETGVFLKVFVAVGCLWALFKLAGKIRKIGADEIDNQILRVLRRPAEVIHFQWTIGSLSGVALGFFGATMSQT